MLIGNVSYFLILRITNVEMSNRERQEFILNVELISFILSKCITWMVDHPMYTW